MGLQVAIRRKLEKPIKPWENLSKSIFEPHEARRIAVNIAKPARAVAGAIIRSVELIARTSCLSGLGLHSLCFSFLRQLAQQPHRQPNRVGDAFSLRCSFAARSFDFHYPVFNRVGSVNSAAVKSSCNLHPVSRLLHTLILIEAAPCVHPTKARTLAR